MTKCELEEKAEILIRRGFDKFIMPTLKYFNKQDNIDLLSNQECIDIINFINRSNTKLSDAYWILRTNLTKIEYEEQLAKLKTNFVESAYKHTNRKVVQHRFQKQNFSRGYSGWAEINNNRFYCRSQGEFIWLTYLHMIYSSSEYTIKMEDKIFHLENISYKPDIFIYKNDILIKVFEIKSSQVDILQKYHDFKIYFQTLDIEFEILLDQNLILKKYPIIKTKLNDWKNNDAHIQKDMKGKNNPRFGMPSSEETKKKIGIKIKARFADSEFKKKFKEIMKNSCTEEIKIKSMRSRMLSDFIKIKKYCNTFNLSEFEALIKKLKKEGILRLGATLSIQSIIKYFSSLENLYNWEQNENNIN